MDKYTHQAIKEVIQRKRGKKVCQEDSRKGVIDLNPQPKRKENLPKLKKDQITLTRRKCSVIIVRNMNNFLYVGLEKARKGRKLVKKQIMSNRFILKTQILMHFFYDRNQH